MRSPVTIWMPLQEAKPQETNESSVPIQPSKSNGGWETTRRKGGSTSKTSCGSIPNNLGTKISRSSILCAASKSMNIKLGITTLFQNNPHSSSWKLHYKKPENGMSLQYFQSCGNLQNPIQSSLKWIASKKGFRFALYLST